LVPFTEPILDIAVGSNHAIVITVSSKVYAWGQTTTSGIFDGRTCMGVVGAVVQSPTQINVNDIVRVFAGGTSTYLVDKFGQVQVCGNNANGQLGLGDVTSRYIPVLNKRWFAIRSFQAGFDMASSVDARQRGWIVPAITGKSFYTPQFVSTLEGNVKTIAAGNIVTFFGLKNGTFVVCGTNVLVPGGMGYLDPINPVLSGKLNPSLISAPVPVLVPPSLSYISVGTTHTLFLFNNGTAMSSGSNVYGQLGYNTTEFTTGNAPSPNLESSLPRLILNDVTHLKALFHTTILIVNATDLYTMGQFSPLPISDPMAQRMLGGSPIGNSSRTTPTNIMSFPKLVTQVDASAFHALFLLDDGSVWTYGLNVGYQLGLGLSTTAVIEIPTIIPSLTNITSVYTSMDVSTITGQIGSAASCAIVGKTFVSIINTTINASTIIQQLVNITSVNSTFVNGTWVNVTTVVETWVNTTITSLVNASRELVNQFGHLYCWGDNSQYRFGVGNTLNLPFPTLLPQFQNISVVHVAMGVANIYVITSLGNIWVSGDSTYGQLGIDLLGNQQVSMMIPRVSGAAKAFAGVRHGYFITQCPPNRSGPNCEYNICFGKTEKDPTVCGTQGDCVGEDTCSCFPPAVGPQCQNTEFHWRTGAVSGDWTSRDNWYILRSGVVYNAVS
jgi:alpha-tubulin suppressor-like RCC1 family protein